MNLSPLEITEVDCGTHYGFSIVIQNKAHAKSLVNRYYKVDNTWELTTLEYLLKNIGNEITIRSPITCQTGNFKLCEKCFGEYDVLQKRYVGIHTGAVVSERLTQLSMRSFHTSGQANLHCNTELKTYIKYNLLEIKNYETYCELHFKNEIEDTSLFQDVPGFLGVIANKVSFSYDLGIINNQDIGYVIKEINKCLQTENKAIVPLDETYHKLLTNVLSVGDIYSCFIELILSILYTGYEQEIIRYQLKKGLPIKIEKKFSVKEAHNFISPVLSLLYEPNIHSIKKYYDTLVQNEDSYVSIYEKIWLDMI